MMLIVEVNDDGRGGGCGGSVQCTHGGLYWLRGADVGVPSLFSRASLMGHKERPVTRQPEPLLPVFDVAFSNTRALSQLFATAAVYAASAVATFSLIALSTM